MAKITKITKGMQFRSVIADCNALWETIRPSGKQAWICEVVNEPFECDGKTYPGDHAGQQKAFLTSEIQSIMGFSDFWNSLADKGEKWYNNLTLGSTVHYNNGFNEFTRCEVIEKDGQKMLLPFALVGEWGKHNLPRRDSFGEIYYPYYSEKILKAEPFRPHASIVFEYPEHPRRENEIDPRNLPAISFEVPPMTPEEKKNANAEKFAAELVKILQNHECSAQERLESVKSKLETL